MKKKFSLLLIFLGFSVTAIPCMSRNMSIQGPTYSKSENSITALVFLAIIVGLILFLSTMIRILK
jgi:hypothetical protein